jgi:two-component system nitrogen regulation sensor histidine kinase NtrY
VTQLGFRRRLFLFLGLFAVVPAVLITFAWGGTVRGLFPMLAGKAAWDTVSTTGSRVIEIARDTARATRDTAAINEHERALANATTRSRQFELIAENAPGALIVASLLLLAILGYVAARVAGHLARQLSRPLDELVSWTGLIARREPLPPPSAEGAPEFGVLREGMRRMADDIEAGRRAALEAKRLEAMRETSRQVAHELKNPLTPIRFAIARLKGRVPPDLDDTVAILDVESTRLDQMARSFAQFGRLPDGPISEVDIAELVTGSVRMSVPDELPCTVDVPPGLSVMGRSDALGRALGNVLINAVEACGRSGTISVTAIAEGPDGNGGVTIAVRDTGPGIEPAKLATIWDPYVTNKAGGTGLGLAIVRQTIEAHAGRVEAESVPGAGMTIRLLLPATQPRALESVPKANDS